MKVRTRIIAGAGEALAGSALETALDPRAMASYAKNVTQTGTAIVTEAAMRTVGSAGGAVIGAVGGIGFGLVDGVKNAMRPATERREEITEQIAVQKLALEARKLEFQQKRTEAAERKLAKNIAREGARQTADQKPGFARTAEERVGMTIPAPGAMAGAAA